MKHISWFLAAALLIGAPLLLAGAHAQVTRESLTAGPPMSASSGDVAAGVITATLPAPTANGASPQGTWYLTGLEITGQGATSGSGIVCTITGLESMTLTYDFAVLIGATLNNSLILNWPGGLAGNPGTAVVASCPSFGGGNLHSAITIHGVLVR